MCGGLMLQILFGDIMRFYIVLKFNTDKEYQICIPYPPIIIAMKVVLHTIVIEYNPFASIKVNLRFELANLAL